MITTPELCRVPYHKHEGIVYRIEFTDHWSCWSKEKYDEYQDYKMKKEACTGDDHCQYCRPCECCDKLAELNK